MVGFFTEKYLNNILEYITKSGDNMGLYLSLFWIFLLIFFIIYLISFRVKELSNFVEDYGGLVLIIRGSFLIMAIVTDDPVSFFEINIPIELQWLGSLIAFGFGSWQVYLRPLKNKVYEMDRELGEVKTSVNKVESNVSLLLNKLIKK